MIFTPEPCQKLIETFQLDHDRAGIFAGVGLGKTASTLSALHTLRAEGGLKAALVVAPLRVATLTWPNEIRKWDQFRRFKVEQLRDNGDRPSGKADIYLTNWERLDRLGDLSFCDTIIYDELTKAKNHKSVRVNDHRPLLRGHRRWGLTGTPRPNSLLELFAQVRLLDDGKRLGPSYSAFESAYCEPVDYDERKFVPKPGMEELVYQKIHDLCITLRSSDYLDIPDTTVEDVEVTLPASAKAAYAELEKELIVLLTDKRVVVTAANAGVLVNKLLQIASGACYSQTEGEERTTVHVHDAKVEALRKTLKQTGEPAIIATNFIHERERICRAVPGAVDAHKFKGDLEDAWNSKRIKYLVADPRGLGHGLNLQQGGRDTIWFSPCHSRELYDQFNGRLARRGQQNPPRIFRLVCPGTMDDCVVETLRNRGNAQGEMLEILTNFRLQKRIFS